MLLFLTVPLSYMPNCVLSAIVFLIGLKLINLKGMADIARLRQGEFAVALATAIVVVAVAGLIDVPELLRIRREDSRLVGTTQALPVGGYAKVVNNPEKIFTQDIGSATYIAYTSDRNIIGFQLNASADGTMLDALPGLPAAASGDFP